MQTRDEWIADRVVTRDGRVVSVRATARRPHWGDLPASAREVIAVRLGSEVTSTSSTGIGFTPGFASRLDLADGRRVFVKAASDADDARSGWALSEAYREEIRKLRALPSDLPAPALLWTGERSCEGGRADVDAQKPATAGEVRGRPDGHRLEGLGGSIGTRAGDIDDGNVHAEEVGMGGLDFLADRDDVPLAAMKHGTARDKPAVFVLDGVARA